MNAFKIETTKEKEKEMNSYLKPNTTLMFNWIEKMKTILLEETKENL